MINNSETINRQLETITAREETLTETPLKSLTLSQKNKLLLQLRLDHLDYSLFNSLSKVKPASIEGIELKNFYQEVRKNLSVLQKTQQTVIRYGKIRFMVLSKSERKNPILK